MKQLTLSEYLINTYGEKIYKISLSSGCTCPNRDGTKGTSGCAFCLNGSGEFATRGDIDFQFEEAKAKISEKTKAKRFIAYFQSFSNTYGNVEELTKLYKKVALKEEVAILSIATRPDCINDDVIKTLKELSLIKPVWVELGLQTANIESARKLNLGYDKYDFIKAFNALKEIGVKVIAHVIFSLPDESEEDSLDTVRFLSELSPAIDGVKIQMLHVLKGTPLGDRYIEKPFRLYSLEEYGKLLKRALEILPESVVIHRITGDPPRKYLLAPLWTIDKKKTLKYLNKYTIGKGGK